MRVALSVVILVLGVVSAAAQTGDDLKAKYGKPAEVYAVSRNIWMAPEFAADGQVCRVRLFPRRTDGTTNMLGPKLPFNELADALNALVPPDQRGGKKQPFGVTATGGPAAWTTYGYERVTFTFVSGFTSRGDDDSPPLRKGDFVFPNGGAQNVEVPESSPPAADDFEDSRSSATDIVSVKWNGRKCAGDK